jgi:hypothetical protein
MQILSYFFCTAHDTEVHLIINHPVLTRPQGKVYKRHLHSERACGNFRAFGINQLGCYYC